MKILYAFDPIELNGDDLRRDPLEVRKATLASIVAKASPGIRFNEHIGGDGSTISAHACKMGLEGIVSKRKGSTYRSGCSPDWLKMKNRPGCADFPLPVLHGRASLVVVYRWTIRGAGRGQRLRSAVNRRQWSRLPRSRRDSHFCQILATW